jgi:predicted kinase
VLIVFGGLPGTGKTTIARELARQIGATHLRVDSIEQAIRACAPLIPPLHDAGYRIAYAMAEDNLRIGCTVVADSVNPLQITRDAWLEVGKHAHVSTIEIEIICSDPDEHRVRVEKREPDILGLRLPTWQDVVSREYQAWNREHLVIDSAIRSIDENVRTIRKVLAGRSGEQRIP